MIDLAVLAKGERAASVRAAQVGEREVWFAEDTSSSFRPTPIYRRERLPLDAMFVGPAVIEQLDCTTAIEPGNRVRVDRLGNLLVRVQ